MSFINTSTFRQPPPVWEMAVPFKVDPQGIVDFDTNPYAWARTHILALLLTSPGERVMRPTYGAGVRNFVFESNDPFVEAQMVQNIKTAVARWEPNIRIADIKVVPRDNQFGVFELRIAITVGNSPTPYAVAFTVSNFPVEVQAR